MPKVTVEIPEAYLLQIATHGRMGTGEFSDLMRIWAKKECIQLKLADQLKKMQLDKLAELRTGIRNILGDEAMQLIDKGISAAKVAIPIVEAAMKKGGDSE